MESSVPKAMFIFAIFLMGFFTSSEGARDGPMGMMTMKMMTQKEAHEAIDRLYNPKAFGGHGVGGYGFGGHGHGGYAIGGHGLGVYSVPVVPVYPVVVTPVYGTVPYGGSYPSYGHGESEAAVPINGKVAHDQVDHKRAPSP